MIIAARFLVSPLLVMLVCSSAMADEIVKNVVIRADRDIGYFVGDLISAEVEVTVPDGWQLRKSSLPHEGPIDYWLDLRQLDVEEKVCNGDRVFILALLYQNFYDALDVRRQEILSFPLYFSKGDRVAQADVPAWTISVSPLREIAPPPQSDPKDYMRADISNNLIDTGFWLKAATLSAFVTMLSFLSICWKLAWWPFRPGLQRPFTLASREIARLRETGDTREAYMQAILILHRSFDSFVGKRLLAEDISRFLTDHPQFFDARDALFRFFDISRVAFFRSDADRAQHAMPFASLKAFADTMARIERRI